MKKFKYIAMILCSMPSIALAQTATHDCDNNAVDSTCTRSTYQSYGIVKTCSNPYACQASANPEPTAPSSPTIVPSSSPVTQESDVLSWDDNGSSGSSESIPQASQGNSYSATLVGATSSTGLNVSYSYSMAAPSCLNFNGLTISGTSCSSGQWNVIITADDGKNTITRNFTIDSTGDYLVWENPEFENPNTPMVPADAESSYNHPAANNYIGQLPRLMGLWQLNGDSAPNRIKAISSSGRSVFYYIVPLSTDLITQWDNMYAAGSYKGVQITNFGGEIGIETTNAHLMGQSGNTYDGYQKVILDSLVGRYGTTCSSTTQTLTAIMASDGVATTQVPEYFAVAFMTGGCNGSGNHAGGGSLIH